MHACRLVGTYPWRRIYYTRSAQLTVPRGSEHTVTLKRGNFLVGQQLRDPQDQGVREGLLKAVRTVTGDIGGMNEAPVVEAALNAYQELWDSHETRRFVIGQPRTPKVKKAKKRKEQQGGGEDDHIPPRKRRRKGGVRGVMLSAELRVCADGWHRDTWSESWWGWLCAAFSTGRGR
jgi:hypothetical protein